MRAGALLHHRPRRRRARRGRRDLRFLPADGRRGREEVGGGRLWEIGGSGGDLVGGLGLGRLLGLLLSLGLHRLRRSLGGLGLLRRGLGVLLGLLDGFGSRLQTRLELLHLFTQLGDFILLVLDGCGQRPLLLPLRVDSLRVRLNLGRLLRRVELLHRIQLPTHRLQQLLHGDDPLATIRCFTLSLPLVVHRGLDLILEALIHTLRRLEFTRERQGLCLLLVQLSLQERYRFLGLLLGAFAALGNLRVHVRPLSLQQRLLLLELTHELTLQHKEIVFLLLELLILGVSGVVGLFGQSLHLLLVVRLQLRDA